MNISEKLRFMNRISWVAKHEDGIVFASGMTFNQVQNDAKNYISDMFCTGTHNAVDEMGIGTGGTGSGAVTLTALVAHASHEAISSGSGITDAGTGGVDFTASFTNVNGSVDEAGLFPDAYDGGVMYFYNDTGLGVPLTVTDTLTINWEMNY